MRTYIHCPKRKGQPKIAIDVCLRACKYNKKCKAFLAFRNPPLFPEIPRARAS